MVFTSSNLPEHGNFRFRIRYLGTTAGREPVLMGPAELQRNSTRTREKLRATEESRLEHGCEGERYVDGGRAAAMEVGTPPGVQRGRGVRVSLEQRRRHGGSLQLAPPLALEVTLWAGSSSAWKDMDCNSRTGIFPCGYTG